MTPPRMIVKIDIEKAYDSLSLTAILATLSKMNFLNPWISGSKLVLSLAPSPFSSMVFLHSGLTPLGGLDRVTLSFPIFSSQFPRPFLNSMLNFSFRQNMIQGFNCGLHYNFNHLMYADDVVLISRASRMTARNINQCFSIYSRLTGQTPNLSKSVIDFPFWFNSQLANIICSILRFRIASFPLTYLRVLITTKRLAISSFYSMIERIHRTHVRWKHSKLSPAAKTILINSSLLSIPTYYLSIYPILDSILHKISKIVRNFLWHKGGN